MKSMRACGAVLLLAVLAGCGSDDDASAERLRILVTNDDGVAADGIDQVVEALAADPNNDVVVCGPNGNRSGTGDMTGPSGVCGDLSVAAATTLSGYPATAINGCPADSVNYALDVIYPSDAAPHVVISGINEGQNVSEQIATQISGTVGAAKTAARGGVPALAASQGLRAGGAHPDYPSGVAAVLEWLDDHRAELLAGGGAPTAVDNLNVPSCEAGTIRGTLSDVPLAASLTGFLDPQDCTSTLENPLDDVQAFLNGYITLSTVPLD